VALRPWPEDPEALLEAVETTGLRHVLLRLHPWQEDQHLEEELARELHRRGLDLAFSLPQSRELVRDPARWQGAIERLAGQFLPYGGCFQIGQAPNRSKWGVWRPSEYAELYRRAAEALKRVAQAHSHSEGGRPQEVLLLGPAVIDWEPHATAALLNLEHEGLTFDILSSLLYVDRRGAPESRQMGLDARSKVTLLKALAETSRNCPSGRSWITEVNWPLREGPHSPAGRDVAVSEDRQASYLVRYYIEALTTGLVERVYWWQLIHKGYGLIDPGALGDAKRGELRRRPAFHALVQMEQALRGSVCEGRVGTASERQRLYRFRRSDRSLVLVGWSLDDRESPIELAGELTAITSRDGQREVASGRRAMLASSPSYFEIEGPAAN
jgi:hypothetical protein